MNNFLYLRIFFIPRFSINIVALYGAFFYHSLFFLPSSLLHPACAHSFI